MSRLNLDIKRLYNGKMSRGFIFSTGEFYHLYNRGNDKRTIFCDKKDYERFLSLLYLCNSDVSLHRSNYFNLSLNEILELDRGEGIVDIGAYCLMPNHFHILVHEKKEGGISIFMQKVSTAYTMYFNNKYERSGSLFEGRFRAKHISGNNHLKYLYSYIHLNPIKIRDAHWKERDLPEISKYKQFLYSYNYSSYIDYVNNSRLERYILSKTAFPEYFGASKDFDEFINDWLGLKNVKVEP